MRKFLLLTMIGTLLTITSCSKEESVEEISQEEKEQLVKETLIEFNKSAVKNGKFQVFKNTFRQKTADDQFTQEELETMVQEFLGDQTQDFLDLYYQLEALNITSEEFRSIADQYEELRLEIIENLNKRSRICGNGNSLFSEILAWAGVCE